MQQQLSQEDFDWERERYARLMRGTFSTRPDALSGRQLDVSQQLVPIRVKNQGREAPAALKRVRDVHTLIEWLDQHEAREHARKLRSRDSMRR